MTTVDRIKQLLQEGVDKEHFPGAHFAIVTASGSIQQSYVGYKQTHPHKISLDGTEIYDCASLTKVVSTTTMIMKLIQDKQLSLQTKVVDILHNFKHPEITIEHLLTHTSGLPADIRRANTLKNRDDVYQRIFSMELINPIGKHIVYSDVGFILLGLIIQKITKLSLHEFATRAIFAPLGMDDTGYQPNRDRCAPTEERNDDVYQGFLQGLVHDEKAFALKGNAGHAGMFSTVKDLARFIQMFLQQDEQVLSVQTMNELFVPRAYDTNKNNYPLIRSYGWDKPTKGGTAGDLVNFDETIVHTGFTGCNMWIDRHHGVGFVMLSNAVHPKRQLNGIIPYRKIIGTMILSDKEEQQ